LPENCVGAEGKAALSLVRVHAFAYAFAEEEANVQTDKLRKARGPSETSSSAFGAKKSVFLSNK
jgi:hypothetical protein